MLGRSINFAMLHRLLPAILIISALFYLAFNFQAIRRDIAYKLHISGDPTTSCCTEEQALKSDGKFDENDSIAIFNSQVIDYPKTSLAYSYSQQVTQQSNPDRAVLGTTTTSGEEKWIEVTLSDQRLRAWEGNRIVMEFPISSGKWAPTPQGTYNIWHKTRNQTMSGGSKELGTYYNLSNVPNNMFFYKGYAIHGAYWHNNFGQPMSHGCVNSPLAYAAQLFDWAGPVLISGVNTAHATAENPGTRVYIH